MHYTVENVNEHCGYENISWYNISVFDLTEDEKNYLLKIIEGMYKDHLSDIVEDDR